MSEFTRQLDEREIAEHVQGAREEAYCLFSAALDVATLEPEANIRFGGHTRWTLEIRQEQLATGNITVRREGTPPSSANGADIVFDLTRPPLDQQSRALMAEATKAVLSHPCQRQLF